MVGREVHTPKSSFSRWGWFWLLCGLVGAAGAGITRNPVWAAGALCPLAWGAAFLLARSSDFTARFTVLGIKLAHGTEFLPYDQIRAVVAPATADVEGWDNFVIHVEHTRGRLSIPATINGRSREVFAFLQSQAVPEEESREVHPELRDYLDRQDVTFGAHEVWVFHPRLRTRARRLDLLGRNLSVATILTGAVWLMFGLTRVVEPHEHFLIQGQVALGLGGLCLLLVVLNRASDDQPSAGHFKDAGLIVSPAGMAVMQGRRRKEISWENVRDIKYRARANFALTPAGVKAGVVLATKGGRVTLLDIYHRPLKEIHERILDCWQRAPEDAPP
jgi:hypothetical protein